MKHKRGFTLIELLVVVLIIGILSAIALPQYTIAVEKSRAAEAMTNIATMKRQMQVYIMENGLPSDRIGYEEFANVELPCEWDANSCFTKYFQYGAGITSSGGYIEIYRTGAQGDLYALRSTQEKIYNDDSAVDGWYNACITETNDLGRKICKQYEALGWEYVDNDL